MLSSSNPDKPSDQADAVYTFSVTRQYRGIKTLDTVQIIDTDYGSSCARGFNTGDSFIIYAIHDRDFTTKPARVLSTNLYVSACLRTRSARDTAEIARLEEYAR